MKAGRIISDTKYSVLADPLCGCVDAGKAIAPRSNAHSTDDLQRRSLSKCIRVKLRLSYCHPGAQIQGWIGLK
jgi:hypothetical protein